MADFLRAGAEIAKGSINPVSIIPALVVGIITFLILGPLSAYGGYKLMKDGTCPEEDKNCKENSWVLPVVLFMFATVISFLLGRFVYLIMFSIANPKMAAGIFAMGMVSSAIS